MARTKKVGFTGKYGARYGRKTRQRILKVGDRNRYDCPGCTKKTLVRESSGIWACKKCGYKVAGKAYKPA